MLKVRCEIVEYRLFVLSLTEEKKTNNDLVHNHPYVYSNSPFSQCFVCGHLPKVISFYFPSWSLLQVPFPDLIYNATGLKSKV